MIDLAYQNIKRQRTRTILTMLGIIIGIAAVVALGSIAEGINNSVQSSLELNAGKITVADADSSGFMFGFAGSELDEDDVSDIKGVSGVKDVAPIFYVIGELSGFSGPEWIGIGMDPEQQEVFVGETITVKDGRKLESGDGEVILIGNDFADSQKLDIGDSFTIKDVDFEVIGVLEESGISDIDMAFVAPIESLQEASDSDIYQMIYVVPDDISKVEVVAERIKEISDDYTVLTSTEIARQAGALVDQIRIFTFGIGGIAAFVGGLGIMNTMIMAVLERRREIGVMKAIGATPRQILQQFMTEALMISLIGGVVGVALGALAAFGLSAPMGGISGFVTPALAGFGIGFALALGVAGGFYPAWKASKLDPVDALRYE